MYSRAALLMSIFLLASCSLASIDKPSTERRVASLIEQSLGSEASKERAFDELEALGEAAVPYLVGHLGDARPLRRPGISLINHAPDAFEGIRHYGAPTVHDAIAAILNQITGQRFVAVYNGATDSERIENRARWVSWCVEKYPAHAASCRGA